MSATKLGDKQEAPSLCSAVCWSFLPEVQLAHTPVPATPRPCTVQDAQAGLCRDLGLPSPGAAEARHSAVRGPRKVLGDQGGSVQPLSLHPTWPVGR